MTLYFALLGLLLEGLMAIGLAVFLVFCYEFRKELLLQLDQIRYLLGKQNHKKEETKERSHYD